MSNIRTLLGNILDNLDRASALSELSPKRSGRYIQLNCPSCSQNTAYISQEGYYIYCNRKNNCGYVNGIVEYIAERDRIGEDEAIAKLAELSNVELPELTAANREENKKIRDKEKLYKDILQIAMYGIWVNEANPVRGYLNSRGYSDSEIITMNFGYLPAIGELKKKLRKLGHSPILIDDALISFNPNNPLLIPIMNPYGTIDGFATRAIDSKTTPKYLYSRGLERGSYFFNMAEAKKSDRLIIVEGIIDALLLSQRGISGAVACGGDSPTQLQISNALKYNNVKTVILCLDNDVAGRKGTSKAIEQLLKYRVNIYVADTSPYKDPDEYIKAKGIEEFDMVLKDAKNWVKWTANQTIAEYDINTDIGRETALNELLTLHNHSQDAIETEYILEIITNYLKYPLEVIKEKLLSFQEKFNLDKQGQAYKELLKDAFKLHKAGDYDSLSNILSVGVAKAKSLSLSNVVNHYTIDQATLDIQSRQDGLLTGYSSLDEYVSIPNGAITLIAGRPSHGKTTFLLNMFLNMVQNNPAKSFFFFSYEESKTALFVKLINILGETVLNETLKYKNTQQIEYYIRGGIKEQKEINPNGKHNPYYNVNRAMKQYAEYTNDNRLWLIDTPLDIQTLSGIVDNLKQRHNVGGIFIDYAQRIKFSGSYDSERIKIARISATLRETSTLLDIPLIVGAQLNRDNAKLKPQLDNLKEAGNLEEDANVVLGLYNWKTAIDKEKSEAEVSRRNCNGLNVSIEDRNIDFEVHILKNRNGVINEAALLSLDAPILKIRENTNKNDSPF